MMTSRWDEEDLAEKLKENPDLSIDTRGNPLPRLARALESQANRHRSKQEEEFLGKLITLAHLHHWLVAHFRPARTEKGWRTAVSADGAGWPDLVLVRASDIYFVEVKSQKGKLTSNQEMWLTTLDKNPTVRCFVWRPSDWDTAVKELS